MEKLDPKSLSTFAYHLFQASFNPKLFVGVLLALDKYFHYYYWKKRKSSDEPEPTQISVYKGFEDLTRFRREEDVIISQMFYEMEYNFPEESLSFALKVSNLGLRFLCNSFTLFSFTLGIDTDT